MIPAVPLPRRPRPLWLRVFGWAVGGAATGVSLAGATGPFPSPQLQALRERRATLAADTLLMRDRIRAVRRETVALAVDRLTQEHYLRGPLGFAKPDEIVYRFVPVRPDSAAPPL